MNNVFTLDKKEAPCHYKALIIIFNFKDSKLYFLAKSGILFIILT